MNDEILIEATEDATVIDADTSKAELEVTEAQAEPVENDTSTPQSDPASEPDSTPEATPSVEEILIELRALREELIEKKKAFEKMSRDIGEFEELYPERNVNEIPDTVWESVRSGIPLAAAYALYERKNALRADTAKSINEINNARTTGAIGREITENFYTPDEVRAMSRSEVKRNYSKIIESMKKWS